MPTEPRQGRKCNSHHPHFSETPHLMGRHYISQSHSQHNASDRLYQIAMQATVANAEAFKGTGDENRKVIHDEGMTPMNKTKFDKTNSSQINSNTTTSNNSTSKAKTVQLTQQQWQLLTDYHEHDLFVRTRSRHPYELGLWTLCLPNNSTCLSIIYHLQNNWKLHTSIICLLGCACLFGLLGLGLAITGVCKSALILRLYYYHSAGECFLVSSITTIASLILYPISADACIQNLLKLDIFKFKSPDQTTLTNMKISSNNSNKNSGDSDEMSLKSIETQYGYTYFLTWIAAVFFFNSFVCMNLDILIQSFVRPVPVINHILNYLAPCWKSSASSSTRSPVSSPSSHSSSFQNQAAALKPNYRLTETDQKTKEDLGSRLKSECSPTDSESSACMSDSHNARTSLDDSFRDDYQQAPQHQVCPIPNILLSDYDQECEAMNSHIHRTPKRSPFEDNGNIVRIPKPVSQDSDQEGEWI
ncbi:unnamed protein product [Trichobilharzia regenti]|nr:unnamed protein product [Trichobilharzia regenti]